MRFIIFICFGFACGCGRRLEPPEPTVVPNPPVLAHTPALKANEALPQIAVDGWLNGAPASLDPAEKRLQVVDVWAAWCPFCRQSAPGLIRLHEKYSGRGVSFVSVTSMARQSAEVFAREFKVSWSFGYGLSEDAMVALGASSGMAAPGYEVAPVLYVVGMDGKIRWSDEQGRFRHAAPEDWERDVDRAIESALEMSRKR